MVLGKIRDPGSECPCLLRIFQRTRFEDENFQLKVCSDYWNPIASHLMSLSLICEFSILLAHGTRIIVDGQQRAGHKR